MNVIFAVVMTFAVLGAQVRAQDSPFALRYRALVDAYRAGETETSVEGLLGLDRDATLDLVRRYVKLGQRALHSDPIVDQGFLRAASMLHAEAAFRCWERWREEEGGVHIDLARQLVDASERPGAPAGSFRRRWYAATALILTNHLTPAEAAAYFEEAVEKLPSDVPLLIAAGWFSERLSHNAAAPGASLQSVRNIRRIQQQDAVRLLTAALNFNPNAAEAALRLARMEVSMGRDAQARTRLTSLLARDELQPLIGYVGRLILGGVHERQGEPREAERLYREAMKLDRVAQSARVALARLLYASGDSSGAADIIEPALTRRTDRDRNDPWSDYQLGYPSVGRVLLDGLRKELRQ